MKSILRCLAVVFAAGLVLPVRAEPIRLEFLVNLKTGERGMPNSFDKLDLGDGSERYVAALRQSGKVTSNGFLASATVVDWGLHEVPTGTDPNGGGPGYLLFTLPSGDKLTMRLQMHLQYIAQAKGARQPFIFGLWEIVGASGSLRQLQGSGVIRVERPSADERLWVLEGEVGHATTAPK